MYPSEFYSLFPPFPRTDEVFVAMSFAEQFTHRWKGVIEPAVERVAVNDSRLKANRVDSRKVSDSILTEILVGISESRLFLADMSTIGSIEKNPVRNANVLYEVGLAQAVRLPEEVLLFRSDDDPLLFDVANVRVNIYDPDGNPEEAKELIVKAILSAFREIDLKKHLTVQRLAESLDYPSWWLLVVAHTQGVVSHPVQRTMGQILGTFSQSHAISTLLQIGALKTRYQQITPSVVAEKAQSDNAEIFMRYECTALGAALFDFAMKELGILQPEMIEYLKKWMQNDVDDQSSDHT